MSVTAARVLRFLKSEDGPTAVEYGIMLALVIVVLMSVITAVGNATSTIWSSDASRIENALS